ncbi:MAG: lipoyl(octanoyl) transferase LipB [Bacteriovoracia bacterium]
MDFIDLGQKDYLEVWELQKELAQKRSQGEIEDTLILVEHLPVYTVGRAQVEEKKEIIVPGKGKVPVISVERGGKFTFHGPDQIVGYPIFKVPNQDLRAYLRGMERALIGSIKDALSLKVAPCPKTLLMDPGQLQTGVWIEDRKLGSIGIAVKKWVAFHGFSLNYSVDLRYFEAIEPCGFRGSIMTNLQKEALVADDDLEAKKLLLKKMLVENFQRFSILAGRDFNEKNRNQEVSL